MVEITEYAFLSLTIVILYTCLPLIFSKRKETKNLNGTKSKHGKKQSLKPLPAPPLWTLVMPYFSTIKWLRYIGTLHTVIGFNFWRIRFAVINDFQLGKQLFANPIFCGKQTSDLFMAYSCGPYGILNTDGQRWKEQKLFCQKHLKEFGFGTKSMEKFIQNEIDVVIESWMSENGKVFSPNKSFYIPVLNSIWRILTGEKATEQDARIAPLVFQVYETFRKAVAFPCVLLVASKVQAETIRRIHNWIPIFKDLMDFEKRILELRTHFQTSIDSKKKTININESPRDLVDAYLQEISKTTDSNSAFSQDQGELNLLAMMVDFFVAAGDTTATMLQWAMLHLIRNPDIQDEIRNEIDIIVGKDRRPNTEDRLNCPYTEAFTLELLRYSPVAIVGMPHATTEDTNIGAHFIKEGTLVFLNVYNIQFDPNLWEDPESFKPERFLSQDRKSVIRNEAMCAFSLGPRRCIGEHVARETLFLFISAICQRFVLKPDPSLKELPPLKETNSWMLVPDTFSMLAIDRLT